MNEKQFFLKNKQKLRQIYDMINNAEDILLISHERPDGDTSGSAMAMAYMLESFGKSVTLFNKDKLPDSFSFIKKTSEYQSSFDIKNFDLAMAFDGGTYKMFGLHETHPEIFNKSFPLINIDHHYITNENYGAVNLVEDLPSTCSIVLKLFQSLHWEINTDIATSLMLGIYTDTGSLQHSNIDSQTFKDVAFLLKYRANLELIKKNVFRTKTFSQLKLWGRVLSRVSTNSEKVSSSYVNLIDFKNTNTNVNDLTGIVDYLNSIPDSKYSILLTEQENGKVKGSMRTLDDNIDLTKIAGLMGGGGHKKASGFSVKGKLHTEFQWRIENTEGLPENFLQKN